MSALPNQPSSRLDFRISPEHKALIERAASAQGQTVSNFAIASLLKAAEEAIHSETQRVLSARDGRRFLAMLDAAGTPNAALRAAAARYATPRDATPRDATPRDATPRDATPGDAGARRTSKGRSRRER
jgi:uncharacterized protein (DUF1778 family)